VTPSFSITSTAAIAAFIFAIANLLFVDVQIIGQMRVFVNIKALITAIP
jgi:hypothetical protein